MRVKNNVKQRYNNSMDISQEDLILEKELEDYLNKVLSNYRLSYSKISNYTRQAIIYYGNHLMQYFAVEAEIEIFNLLNIYFNGQAKLKGGTDIKDIQVLDQFFNVKVYNGSQSGKSAIKLFSQTTANKIDQTNYYFIILDYSLSEDSLQIILNNIYVCNYHTIKPLISPVGNCFTLTKPRLLKYIEQRDAFLLGESDINKFLQGVEK